jgi:hypothetical protein
VLLIMTALAGVVDAVSILSLGRVFVANMTGNVAAGNGPHTMSMTAPAGLRAIRCGVRSRA